MIGYKLTSQDMTTYNDTLWELGVPKTASGTGPLCSKGWLHYYDSPILAVLLNPIHANILKPRLFECEVNTEPGHFLSDHGFKFGTTSLTLVREIDLPSISLEQRNAFAIECALQVYKDPQFTLWASNWLDGSDRSDAAARAAADAAAADAADAAAARAAAEAAAWAARAAAADAARAAAEAAADAAWAAAAARAAAEAAADAAWTAAWTAYTAADASKPLDLKTIAEEVLNSKE